MLVSVIVVPVLDDAESSTLYQQLYPAIAKFHGQDSRYTVSSLYQFAPLRTQRSKVCIAYRINLADFIPECVMLICVINSQG